MPQQPQARRLYQGAVPTTQTAVYTVDSAQRAIITALRLHNNHTSERIVQVWVVPAAQSPSDTTNLFLEQTLHADQSYQEAQVSLVLEPGDVIYMDADGTGVSCWISGATLIEL